MRVIATAIPEVKLIEPDCFRDPRGFFLESFHAERYAREAGIDRPFVQDNHSRSCAGVLRGIHYQLEHPQGKLVRVTSGRIYDVAIDLRRSSPTFGQAVGTTLSADDHRQLWIPPGFGHGFLVLSASADVLYKTTDYYHPEDEHCLLWCDPELAIEWPLVELDGAGSPPADGMPIVSERDRAGRPLAAVPLFR